MSRRRTIALPAPSIAAVAALALMAACSGPKNKAAEAAPPPKEPVASSSPAPSPPAAAAAPAAPAPAVATPESAPTPPETPLPPPPEPAAQTSAAKEQPAAPMPDALKWLQESEARRVEYEQSLVRLAAERDAAKDTLSRCERDLLELRNPYLPRPKLTPDEAAQIQGKNGIERVKWGEERVADAQAALDAAQKAYDDAKGNPPQ